MEIEIILLPDGSMMLERGSPEQNKILLELLEGSLTDDSLHQFTSFIDDAEILFGDTSLCG